MACSSSPTTRRSFGQVCPADGDRGRVDTRLAQQRDLPTAAVPRGTTPSAATVLRLALLITDPSGEILFWNAEARDALDALPAGQTVSKLDELFSQETIERLEKGRGWAVLNPIGAPHTSWSVRARHLIHSGRSLFLFFTRPATP